MVQKISIFITGLLLGVLITVIGVAFTMQKGLLSPQKAEDQKTATDSAISDEPKYVLKKDAEGATPPPTPTPKPTYYSGPQLWEAVNQSRVEHGVNPLKQLDLLCTIASIRLNHQLELGALDNHAKFVDTVKSVQGTEKYTIAEFLVRGYPTAQGAVDAWLNTLGHSKLLTGGEFIYGCTYAQAGFGVAIAAY